MERDRRVILEGEERKGSGRGERDRRRRGERGESNRRSRVERYRIGRG